MAMLSDEQSNLELEHFRISIDVDGIATVLMDRRGERVNALGSVLIDEAQRVLEHLETDARIVGVVLGSAKRDSFVVGADVAELAKITSPAQATELARRGQDLLSRLEALHERGGKPVVAAIHGPALGGGLEFALACSIRVASSSDATQLGLPEVKLGLIPAAGGTQRLPKIVGIGNALDLILTGKSLRARKAAKLGLVDEVVPEAILLAAARAKALQAARHELPRPKRGVAALRELAHEVADPEFLQQLALEENPVGQRLLFRKAREQLLEQTHGLYPAPEQALDVVRIGVMEGAEAGYAAEADRFGGLVVSREAKALTSLFFAQQELKKDSGLLPGVKAEPRPVRKLGVLGGGLMGAGVAYASAAVAGLPVRINEVNDAGMLRALRYVRGVLDKDVQRRRRRPFEAERVMSRVTATTELAGFGDVDLVVEAVFEDLELKHRVLRDVEARTGPETIFASNTSALPITEIAQASARPERVIGMHYFSPVEKMPLLEIVVTDKTAPSVIATCVQLGKQQGKTVIVVRDGVGFYTSRILAPYLNEAAWILSEGAAVDALDRALVQFGFPVGPATLLDEVGIDVAGKVTTTMERAFGQRMKPPEAVARLLRDERSGRKSGRGLYRYEAGKRVGVDESVYALFGQAKARVPIGPEEVQERLVLQMVNEAARCLEEGILRSARDGDVGAVFGLGFPPFRGGPFSYVDTVGAARIVERLEHYESSHGERFSPAQILRDHARSGARVRG